MAIVLLIVFLSPCAIAGVKYLILFRAGSSGCAYSVGGHFRCHSISVLVFYNQYAVVKDLFVVGDFALRNP